MHRREIHKTFW